jgi:histidine triad (HIT) family protein
MTCVFCTDPSRAGELVFEDHMTLVLLHPDSAVSGHAMVVVRRHVENASDLREDEWSHLTRIQRVAERVLLEETKTDRAILLKLGVQTPHLHLHIYPVSSRLDRAAVQSIIDARVTEPRDAGLGERVCARLTALLR